MRFLHTSDWHLGRLFHQTHLTDDQAHVLDQLVAIAESESPDAIVIAGDVYDRGQPPAEAVTLLDETLQRLIGDLGCRVIAISGNHDSPERLGFGSRLLAASGLHIAGRFEQALTPVVIEDAHGPVHVHALPYADPAEGRIALGRDDLHDHASMLGAQAERIRAEVPAGVRSILVAHAFVTGGEASESERPLSVGGAGDVGAAAFDGFHYVALGHLHRPQAIVDGRVVYSGSLMKYSFSEATHAKGITLVEMDGDGACRTERIPLTPRRDVRVVEGRFDDLLRGRGDDGNREDYVLVRLSDRGAILNAMPQLREVYPNILGLEKPEQEAAADAVGTVHGDHRKRSHVDLFGDFFRQVENRDLSEEELAVYVDVAEDMRREEGRA